MFHEAADHEIYTVAADNTDKGASVTRLTNGSDSKGSPVYSPDGEQIAYLTSIDGVSAFTVGAEAEGAATTGIGTDMGRTHILLFV